MAQDNPLFNILPKTPDLEALVEKEAKKFSKATSLPRALYLFPVMGQINEAYRQAMDGNKRQEFMALKTLTHFLLHPNIPNRRRYFSDTEKLIESVEGESGVFENYSKELSKVHSEHGNTIIAETFSYLSKTIKEIYKQAEDKAKGKTGKERDNIIKGSEVGIEPELLQYISLVDPRNEKLRNIQEADDYIKSERGAPPEAFANRLQETIKEIAKDQGPLAEVVAKQLLRDIQEDPSRENLRYYVKSYIQGLTNKLLDDYRKYGRVSLSKFKEFAKGKLKENPIGYEALVNWYVGEKAKEQEAKKQSS